VARLLGLQDIASEVRSPAKASGSLLHQEMFRELSLAPLALVGGSRRLELDSPSDEGPIPVT
jgi:hypothetical protein